MSPRRGTRGTGLVVSGTEGPLCDFYQRIHSSLIPSVNNMQIIYDVHYLFSFAGFLEFKDVEIKCHEEGDTIVIVVMSEHCKRSGIFWATLQKSCVAIMALIDWEWSRPGSVYDIFCSYGTDSAWKYFLEVYIYFTLF